MSRSPDDSRRCKFSPEGSRRCKFEERSPDDSRRCKLADRLREIGSDPAAGKSGSSSLEDFVSSSGEVVLLSSTSGGSL